MTDWLDLGFTSWRGFYSTVRLLEARGWALSASPAFYFHRVAARDEDVLAEASVWTQVTNRNLTALLSYQPPTKYVADVDLFLGYGISRYSVTIKDQWLNHRATAPSLLGGFVIDRTGTLVVSNRVSFALRLLPVW